MSQKDNKSTPGPWSINDWTQPDREIRIGAKGTPLIAEVCMRDVSLIEHIENAILISKCPEMYDALISANKYFIDLQNKCALTVPDENAWKKISKLLREIKDERHRRIQRYDSKIS